MLTSAAIKRQALSLGFDLCGIARAEPFPELQALAGWLKAGYAGRMTYLNRTARRRADVRQWLPSAQSVICVACVYGAGRPVADDAADPTVAQIARYARGDDYHAVLTTRLEGLLAWMVEQADVPFEARIGVDDAPVQERVYARHAGLGWIGKNTCLINPGRGSWLVLGVLPTSLELEPDTPIVDHCGTCRRCLDACPTGALVDPGVLDARLCRSYLTKLRNTIPDDRRTGMGGHVFGCDICQGVCPHNATQEMAGDPVWLPRPGLDAPRLIDLWRMPDDDLARLIAGSAIAGLGVAGLRRNLAVALGNCGTTEAANVLRESLPAAPAAADGVVAAHVAWALEQGR